MTDRMLPNRRRVLGTTAALGVTAPLLAACGNDSKTTGSDPAADPGTGSASGGASGTQSQQGPVEIGQTKDEPVGGCAMYPDAKVVVTQPTEGEFKAFSAVCTHEGCLVSTSKDGDIPCTCHGSHFSLTDGSVLAGPAPSPLAPVQISVTDGTISQV